MEVTFAPPDPEVIFLLLLNTLSAIVVTSSGITISPEASVQEINIPLTITGAAVTAVVRKHKKVKNKHNFFMMVIFRKLKLALLLFLF